MDGPIFCPAEIVTEMTISRPVAARDYEVSKQRSWVAPFSSCGYEALAVARSSAPDRR